MGSFGDFLGKAATIAGNVGSVVNPALGVVGTLGSLINGSNQNKANLEAQRAANEANLKSVRETNQANREIAASTNAANRQIHQEDNAFNERMWNAQNAYNDPQLQVERLLRAGINPASVFGNGSVSEAGSISASSAPQMQAAQMQSAQFNPEMSDQSMMWNNAFTGVSAFTQARLANSQIERNMNDSQVAKGRLQLDSRVGAANMKNLLAMSKRNDWLGQQAKEQLDYYVATREYERQLLRGSIKEQSSRIRQMDEVTRSHELSNQMLDIQAKYQSRMSEAELQNIYKLGKQIDAQIGLINANTLLSDAQRETEIERKTQQILQNGLSAFDVGQRKELKSDFDNLIRNQVAIGNEQVETMRFARSPLGLSTKLLPSVISAAAKAR